MKYQLTNHQISTELGNEVVILNHQDGIYFGLEDVGQSVWSALQQSPKTLDELVAIVCDEYETTPEVCTPDIESLLQDLIKQKLVEKI